MGVGRCFRFFLGLRLLLFWGRFSRTGLSTGERRKKCGSTQLNHNLTPIFTLASFITKFNNIKSSVYSDYMLILCGDLALSEQHESTHTINKRLGMAQMPFACVMLRMCYEASKYSRFLDNLSPFFKYAFLISLFVILVISKTLLGIALKGVANVILDSPIVFDEAGDLVAASKKTKSGLPPRPNKSNKKTARFTPNYTEDSIKKLLSPSSPTAKLRLQRQSMVALNQLDRFDIQDHQEIN